MLPYHPHFLIVPGAGPVNVTAWPVDSSATAIYVLWSPPPVAERNGIIIDYVVEVSGGGMFRQPAVRVGSNDTILTVRDLRPYTSYTVRVAAVTGGGMGIYSPARKVTTAEDGM